jgi:hypothetical protein
MGLGMSLKVQELYILYGPTHAFGMVQNYEVIYFYYIRNPKKFTYYVTLTLGHTSDFNI